MRIIFVGGGTAGHINPALALAEYVKSQDKTSEILYVGAKNGMEERLVKEEGLDFKGITVSGFSRKINFDSFKKNITTLKNIFISTLESKKIIKDFNPDICVGTGGYVSGPFLRAAAKLGIPFLIHDSNSYPGVTTKLLAKKANKVLIINNEVKKYLPTSSKCEVVGTPVRRKIANIEKNEARENLGIKTEKVILSFGGSLGAKTINNVMKNIFIKHHNENDFTFIHGYGKNEHSFEKQLALNGVNTKSDGKYIIKEYIKNMPECLAAADLVICRSGATTLSEIQASQKPAILVPSPNVAENHQYHNAMALVNEGAASIIEEKDLNEEKLWAEINKILDSEKNIAKNYSKNLKRIAITDSSERIYKIIMDVIKK